MPIDKKYIKLHIGTSGSVYRLPPCIETVDLELYGPANLTQCQIPRSGGAGTTSTQCSKSLLSVNRGRSYGKRTIRGISGSLKTWRMYSLVNSHVFTYNCSNTDGVRVPNSCPSGYNCPTNTVADVAYIGGLHGRRYYTDTASVSCGKSTITVCGFVYGGWGGDAGPNGPGANGSSAYTLTCFRTTTTYYPGAGGGANGGTAANTGTAGTSWWRCKSQGAGGAGGNRCTFSVGTPEYRLPLGYSSGSGQITNTLQYVGGGNGGGRYAVTPTITGSPNCGGYPSRSAPIGILSGCLGTAVPLSSTYYHIFSYQGVYQIVVPVGTTEIKVDALGAGAGGNVGSSVSAPGFSTTTGTTAGGGGGGFARSTLVKNFTTPGSTIDVQVAENKRSSYGCPTYKSSKVSIDGVLEAEAFAAFDVRPGGYYISLGTGWGYNYARNGVTRYGGFGGRGYYTGTAYRGGGGGGAAWAGGCGGTGSNASSTRPSGGGGGAASCSSSGSGGGCSGSTTAGANGGASGSGYPGYGGTPGIAVSSTAPSYGVNGAGGAGGSTTNSTTRTIYGGTGGMSQYQAANSAYAFNGYNPYCLSWSFSGALGLPYGPGGGGGGGYGQSTVYGTAGSGGFFGGGGGGDYSFGGSGASGLVIITITVNSSLAAASIKVNTSTVHTQIIE